MNDLPTVARTTLGAPDLPLILRLATPMSLTPTASQPGTESNPRYESMPGGPSMVPFPTYVQTTATQQDINKDYDAD